jgi:hypothetical protein
MPLTDWEEHMKRYYLAPLSVTVAVLAVALVFWLRSGDLKAPASPVQPQPSALTANAAPLPLTPTPPVAKTEPTLPVAGPSAAVEVPKLVVALPPVAGLASGQPDREAASATLAPAAGAEPNSAEPPKSRTLADLTDKELDELYQVLYKTGGAT